MTLAYFSRKKQTILKVNRLARRISGKSEDFEIMQWRLIFKKHGAKLVWWRWICCSHLVVGVTACTSNTAGTGHRRLRLEVFVIEPRHKLHHCHQSYSGSVRVAGHRGFCITLTLNFWMSLRPTWLLPLSAQPINRSQCWVPECHHSSKRDS